MGPVMTDAYRAQYSKLLAAIATASHVPGKLSVFWPDVGKHYDGDLLVIGRAVDSWFRVVDRQELLDESGRIQVLTEKQALSDKDRLACFVNAWGRGEFKDPARSAFWRVVLRVLIGDSGRRDPSAVFRCAWTNLYKIAPERGNPDRRLQEAQRELCLELLEQELSALAPRRVLAITAWEWFEPFVRLAWKIERSEQPGDVVAAGGTDTRGWVIAGRPDSRVRGRTENRWVKAVLDAFRMAETRESSGGQHE